MSKKRAAIITGAAQGVGAPRPARLPKLTTKNMKTRPADSRYERGSLGGQVRRDAIRKAIRPGSWCGL